MTKKVLIIGGISLVGVIAAIALIASKKKKAAATSTGTFPGANSQTAGGSVVAALKAKLTDADLNPALSQSMKDSILATNKIFGFAPPKGSSLLSARSTAP